jgi:hypothetical protein
MFYKKEKNCEINCEIKCERTPKEIVKHQYIIICFTNEINCEIKCERKWNAINESMTDFFVWLVLFCFVWFVYFEKVKQ